MKGLDDSMEAIRTLIVDDEARIRGGIERLLGTCEGSFEIVASHADGKAALDYLHQINGAIDLLITDVKMPVMDGLTLIKEARQLYAFYPVLISGYDDFEYVQAAIREGAVDYLLKPIDRDQFRARMANIQTIIRQNRLYRHQWGEMKKKENKLIETRQTQMLSYVTSAGLDMTRLGYWVDEFPKGDYLLLYISLDPVPVKTRSYSSKDWGAYSYALDNIIGEVTTGQAATSDSESWYWKGGDSDFWVLLHRPVREHERTLEEVAAELSKELRSAIRSHTPFTVSVAYGDTIEDLYLLPEAKQQALSLMNYRLLDGSNQSFHAHPDAWAGGRMDADLARFAHRLRVSVEQANAEEAAQISKQFFEKLKAVESPTSIKRAVQNVFMLIHSAGLEHEDAGGSANKLEQAFQVLNRAANLHELKVEVDRLMNVIIHQIRQARQSGSIKPVEQAKAWIAEHLAGDISIKSIADQVHMNPSYFCRYFKTQTGDTILDYITSLRMEKAKELLLAFPGMKLQDICQQIGYVDVKYFSRLFKQHFGETPSKFREHAETNGVRTP